MSSFVANQEMAPRRAAISSGVCVAIGVRRSRAAPAGTVWWRDFVHQRPLAAGKRQLVVHLINAPATPEIESVTQPLAAIG